MNIISNFIDKTAYKQELIKYENPDVQWRQLKPKTWQMQVTAPLHKDNLLALVIVPLARSGRHANDYTSRSKYI